MYATVTFRIITLIFLLAIMPKELNIFHYMGKLWINILIELGYRSKCCRKPVTDHGRITQAYCDEHRGGCGKKLD